jgi:aryl-alcohol dehydrogenase-like predicted oxidoreductase
VDSRSPRSRTATGSPTARRSENDTATECVRAALDAGISSFDTADVYANTAAETVLGEALKGERRESLEIFTKVYWPTGPGGKNDTGLSRKHIMESINGSLKRLQTDYVDLYQAHRFDTETPLEETMQALADVVRQGKALYIGVSEWTADQIRAGAELAKELNFQLISSQPQYSMLWRVIEPEVMPACEELGISQIVWSPMAQGVLSGKYAPGQPPAGRLAGHRRQGWRGHDLALDAGRRTRKGTKSEAGRRRRGSLRWRNSRSPGCSSNDNVAAALVGASRPEQVADNVKAAGVRLDADDHDAHRRGARRHRGARPGQDSRERPEDSAGLTPRISKNCGRGSCRTHDHSPPGRSSSPDAIAETKRDLPGRSVRGRSDQPGKIGVALRSPWRNCRRTHAAAGRRW